MQIIYQINFDNIPDWPKKLRFLCCSFLALAILIIFYVFDIYWLNQALGKAQSQERTLKLDLEENHPVVANILIYKKQREALENAYKNIMKQLPANNQLDSIIDSINAASSAANLEISTLTPQQEEIKSFYTILPIKVTANGTYYQISDFAAKISALNYIIIPMDFSINAVKNSTVNPSQAESLNLTMILNAYYYRALNLEEARK